jgi:hypothetical protein
MDAVPCGKMLGMDAFPEFMKNPANRIARSNLATPGVEGYVLDYSQEVSYNDNPSQRHQR